MNSKSFFSGFATYIQILLTVFTIILAIDKSFFHYNFYPSLWVGIGLLSLPLFVLLLACAKPAFAKWIRVLYFRLFRVRVFAIIGWLALVCFSGSITFIYVYYGFSGEQAFLNILAINIVLIFFISLVLSGRFQLKDPKALLIQPEGQGEIYLYHEGSIRHIPDPPTLRFLGYSFSEVQRVSEKEFSQYKELPRLESVSSGDLIQANGHPEVYVVILGEKHHVPDPDTLYYLQSLNQKTGRQRLLQVLPPKEV